MSDRPRLLDLFCGAGGAAMGYHRAGFDVVGVDIKPQPRYPFEFHQGDALEVLDRLIMPAYDDPADWLEAATFAAIHASPPCKHFTKTGWAIHFGYRDNHEDLLTPTRERLIASGIPWVIENVPGAPMRPDMVLCGSQVGLHLRRHRWFETSWRAFDLMPPCAHPASVPSPHGHPRRADEALEWAAGMDIDWMDTPGLAQAIPPAYTEHIGAQLLDHLERAA